MPNKFERLGVCPCGGEEFTLETLVQLWVNPLAKTAPRVEPVAHRVRCTRCGEVLQKKDETEEGLIHGA